MQDGDRAPSPRTDGSGPALGAPPPGGDGYKWIALSNTTIGVLMATVNSSIVLISLPAIFRGIRIDPLVPGNVSYLLWMLMGYMVVTAVLVVSLGRIGDMFGRVRIYNLGFLVFTIASVLLSTVFTTGPGAAVELILLRLLQGVGGAMLMANSTAILTDAFPETQRGMALGINAVAGISGSFIGLIAGGLLSTTDWHLVFLVSVPVGLFGTVWAYLKLRELAVVRRSRMDWWGNLTFAAGLVAVLVGITYGIQPYGGSPMGWTNPTVLAELVGGVLVLAVFVLIETRVPEPMFQISLFRIRAFTAGNLASLLASIGRGGLTFMLIIWLQGIWLPLHGHSYESTPLWAAICMLPLTVGFLVAGPLAGVLSDRYGARPFATGGMVAAAATFALLAVLPADFAYPPFAALLLANGVAMGMFTSPNTAAIMNAVPPHHRGAASGMRATFQNSGMTLSIGLFFSLMIAGLSATLPRTMLEGLRAHGVPAAAAQHVANLPPVGSLFAAFLGYNPMATLLGPVLSQVPPQQARYLTGTTFFPQLVSGPFTGGMRLAFLFSAAMMLVAAAASWMRGGRYVHTEAAQPPPAPLAATAAGRPVVTVSATYGTRGEAIARRVAERLDVPFLDRVVTAEVARRLDPALSEELSQHADGGDGPSGILRLFAGAVDAQPLYGTVAPIGDGGPRSEEEMLLWASERVVRDMAEGSGGVILGRGGGVILRDHPRALHVRLDGPPERRVRLAAELSGIDEETARERMRQVDRVRETYMREVLGVDPRDPSLYHMVLDPTVLPLETCVDVIVDAARGRAAAGDPSRPAGHPAPATGDAGAPARG
jgi:MFS family permease